MPYVWNATIYQGSSYRWRFTYRSPAGEPIDISDCEAEYVVSAAYGGERLLELTTGNGGVVLGGVAGTIEINGPAEATGAIPVPAELGSPPIRPGVHQLDLRWPDGTVERLIRGTANTAKRV